MTERALLASATDTISAAVLARITSPVPTRYRLLEDGRKSPIYVYCALDTLEYAMIAQRPFRILAAPPVGPSIQFALTSAGPTASALRISAVIPEHLSALPSVTAMPSRCCPYTHFFVSRQAYETWWGTLPDRLQRCIECVPLREAWAQAHRAISGYQTSQSCECR